MKITKAERKKLTTQLLDKLDVEFCKRALDRHLVHKNADILDNIDKAVDLTHSHLSDESRQAIKNRLEPKVVVEVDPRPFNDKELSSIYRDLFFSEQQDG